MQQLYTGDTAPWQVFIHDAQAFAAAPHPAAEPALHRRYRAGKPAFDPRLLERVYPYARETTLPSKVTATQLKGRALDQEIAENAAHTPYLRPLSQPRFRQEGRGADAGGAGHRHPSGAPVSGLFRSGRSGQVERLRARQLLSPEQASAVDTAALERFLQSSLADEIPGR